MNNYTSTLSKHVSWRHQIIIALALLFSPMPLALAGNCTSTPENGAEAEDEAIESEFKLSISDYYARQPDFELKQRTDMFGLYKESFKKYFHRESIEFYDPDKVLFRGIYAKDYQPGIPMYGKRLTFEYPEVNPKIVRYTSENSGGLATTPSIRVAVWFGTTPLPLSPPGERALVVLDPAFLSETEQVAGMESMAIDFKNLGLDTNFPGLTPHGQSNEKWWPSNIPSRNVMGKMKYTETSLLEFEPNPFYEGNKKKADILDMLANDPVDANESMHPDGINGHRVPVYFQKIDTSTLTFPDGYE